MSSNDAKKNAADQTVDRLRELILDNTYEFGAPLRQAEIAKTLGVSRTPVREALKVLAQEGLIEVTATGRTAVAKVDPSVIQEYYEIRCQLEMWMLELAVPLMTAEDLAAAEAINQRMGSCSEDEWGLLNFEFHRALCQPANKPHTLALVEELYRGSMVRLRRPIYTVRNVERSLRDHRDLLAACAAGDVQAARDRLESHIVLNSHALIERLRAIQARD